eukprot:Hpha_TRINITY_DN15509_c0_g7::TRINITY_DN15509_c0_g7_i1::g.105923::m.105923
MLGAVLVSVVSVGGDPNRFKAFLDENMSPASGNMPLSYSVTPTNYFDSIPANERPKTATKEEMVGEPCNEFVKPNELNAYTFQTERYIATYGLNLYDAAVWSIAKSILGDTAAPRAYTAAVLVPHRTKEFNDIRGDNPCKGDVAKGQCNSSCGFCYGDTGAKTQDASHAYFFRTISDLYSIPGSQDERCPSKSAPWTWNDWKPILGENSWANFLGTLTTAYVAYGRNAAAIPDNCAEMTLAADLVPTLMAMRVGYLGAIYYAPRNTVSAGNKNAGSTVSIENQASTLAGLKAFRWVLQQKGSSSSHYHMLGDVNTLIDGIQNFLVSAWDRSRGFFRQGGTYEPSTNTWTWHQSDSPEFAVDCQTWVATVLGATYIDQKLGAGTALGLWSTVKSHSGYGSSGGMVKGVGYTDNSYAGEVFSGEWTFGAINWLRVMAADSPYSAAQKSQLRKEADFMRSSIDSELTKTLPIQGKAAAPCVLYSNKRYYIPFGWYANPIPSTASTGWAVAVDAGWNPLMINGAMSSAYSPTPSPPGPTPPTPPSPTPPPPSPPSSAACSANPGCAKLGLAGNCCPANDGTILACCNEM